MAEDLNLSGPLPFGTSFKALILVLLWATIHRTLLFTLKKPEEVLARKKGSENDFHLVLVSLTPLLDITLWYGARCWSNKDARHVFSADIAPLKENIGRSDWLVFARSRCSVGVISGSVRSGSGQNGEEEKGGEERRLIIFLLEQQHSASI